LTKIGLYKWKGVALVLYVLNRLGRLTRTDFVLIRSSYFGNQGGKIGGEMGREQDRKAERVRLWQRTASQIVARLLWAEWEWHMKWQVRIKEFQTKGPSVIRYGLNILVA
jgi:hypothetical protein